MSTSPSVVSRTDRYVYEFDGFRVDPFKRRVLRGEELVPVTPKAFAILLVLLEKRGQVVEKDELIQRVWQDAAVTEANLTQNVSSLRKALGERANDHRYVVTVPGRGYCFVAEVQETPRDATAELPILLSFPEPVQAPAAPLAPGPVAPSSPEPVSPPLAVAVARPRGRRRFLFAGLLLGVVLALAAVALWQNRARPEPRAAEEGASPPAAARSRPVVAVMGFRNLAANRNEDWLRTALSEMLITELAAGSHIRMVSGEEVARVNGTLSLPYTENMGGEDLKQIRELLGADLVVTGTFLVLAAEGQSRLRIDLRVLRAPGGEPVTSLAQVGTEEDLFELVSEIGRQLRRNLGWTEPSPEDTRAVQALLPANEAARLYAQGLVRLRAFDSLGARDLLQRAARADPGSAVIRSALSLAWIGLGYDARAREEAAKAVQLAAHLPKESRLAIQARSDEARKDWAKASEIYRSLWTFYPDDLEYGLRLASCLSSAGRGADALATVRELRKLPAPAGEDPRIDLAEAQIAKRLSSYVLQMEAARRAESKGRRSGESLVVAQALMLQGDGLLLVGRARDAIPLFRESRDLFARAGNQSAEALVLTHAGVAMHEQGQLAAAERLYNESLVILTRTGSVQGAAMQVANLGMLYQDIGDQPRAESLLEKAHASFTAGGDRVLAARALDAIGTVRLARGDLEGARQRFDQVLVISRQTGNRTDEARALSYQGGVLARLGSLSEGRRLHEEGAAISRQVGDPVRGAGMIAASAEILTRQGDLREARRRLELALRMKQEGNDRLGAAEILGLTARLAERMGNLAEARQLSLQQLSLAREAGSRSMTAAALQDLARWSLDAGDLAGARRQLDEALRLRTANGEALDAADLRLELSRVMRREGNPKEAARIAGELADWYGEREMEGFRARALARLAQALLADGRLPEARAAAGQAQAIAVSGEDLGLRIDLAVDLAPVQAAVGDPAAALDLLRWAIREADRTGAMATGLEARLELSLLQIRNGDPAAASATLQEVRRKAGASGFLALARRADQALGGARPGPLG
ncbi:MAG: tetratricopeptide repeat protein [Thermoanaerobaculia bacterium]